MSVRETIVKSRGKGGIIPSLERESAWFASEKCSQATAPSHCSSSVDLGSSDAKDDEEWSTIEDDSESSSNGSFEIDRTLSTNR